MPGFARAVEKSSAAASRMRSASVMHPLMRSRNVLPNHGRALAHLPAFDFGRISVHAPEQNRSRLSENPDAGQRPEHLAHIVQQATVYGSGARTQALPHLEHIQRSFGHHDVRGVRTRQDQEAGLLARSIGARAYTTGEHIAFSSAADLRTAAHEAAHVVQQRAGVRTSDGFSRRGDVYERHANAVASRVVEGRSAETLLDRVPLASCPLSASASPVVQRDGIDTNFGTFKTTKYDTIGSAGNESGIDIELDFDPNPAKVNAKKIGLTQSIRYHLGGTDTSLFPSGKNRMVASGTGAGMQIDRYGGGKFGNPLYAADTPATTDKLGDTATDSSWGQHGFHYKEGDTVKHQMAILKDKPSLPGHGKNSGQTFESVALAVDGVQSGTYMGSVSWGWSSDGANKFTKQPLTLKEKGSPSAEFKAAATQWNKTSVGGTVKTVADPTSFYDNSYQAKFSVAKDTEVQITDGAWVHNDETYDEAKIKAGPKANSVGRVKVNDVNETGGTPVIKLPTP